MVSKHRQWAAAAVALGLSAAVVAPALALDALGNPIEEVTSEGGGLVDGLLTGEGGLLGPRGLLGSEGGLVPSLLGGHTTPGEFAEGAEDLVDGMGYLAGEMTGLITSMPGAEAIGGDRVGEGNNIGGGLLGSLLGGVLGRA